MTQIEYDTERVKRMVGKVHLQRHQPLRPGRLRPIVGGVAEGFCAAVELSDGERDEAVGCLLIPKPAA